MKGRFKDLTFSRDGEQIVSFSTREDCRELCDKLTEAELVITVKKYSRGRSLNSNGYAWALMERIAEVIGSDKDSVYEQMLQRYGAPETYTDGLESTTETFNQLSELESRGLISGARLASWVTGDTIEAAQEEIDKIAKPPVSALVGE